MDYAETVKPSLHPAFTQPIQFVSGKRRAEMVADYLCERIEKGELQEGDQLPTEEKLCQFFKISRTTLRESIQMLRVYGLLDVSPGRGSFVRKPTDRGFSAQGLLSASVTAHPDYWRESREVMNTLLLGAAMKVFLHDSKGKHVREQLKPFIVTPQGKHTEQEDAERSWRLCLMHHGENVLAHQLCHKVLHQQLDMRQNAFKCADRVMRTVVMQTRVDELLAGRKGEEALRTFEHFLRHN